jgi:HYR domain-containing protein/Kelch motif protein/galactose oxidase-like protein
MPSAIRFLRAMRGASLGGLLLLTGAGPLWAQGGFSSVGGLVFSRSSGAVVTTPDGRVLVISDNSAERYDPATRLFSFAGWLLYNHGSGVTATLLADGTVLIAGGDGANGPAGLQATTKAEVFDPVSGSSSATAGDLTTARGFHTATRLDDGRVLLAGGHSGNFYNSALASAELYDPATGTFAATGSMSVARQNAAAVAVAGRVLITGGYDTTGAAQASADVFDAGIGGFAPGGGMLAGRADHTATLLNTGVVLVAGGHTAFPGPSLSSTERYDPVSATFSAAADMSVPRGAHTASSLADGRVLIAGGFTEFPFGGQTLSSAEIYDPASDTFAPTHGMGTARGRHMAASLASGDVVVAGGLGNYSNLSSAELFSPTFVDDQPPVITVPADMTVGAFGPEGQYVYYQVFATDNSDSNPTLTCQPPSGLFPIGTTTVTCQATDSWDNTATASFKVTVLPPLEITLTVDGFGSVDSKSGVAVVSGTVQCSRTATGWVSGVLSQVISNRVTLSAFYSTYMTCPTQATAWTSVVTPTGGRFKAGKADVTGYVSMGDQYGSAFNSLERALQLRGKN